MKKPSKSYKTGPQYASNDNQLKPDHVKNTAFALTFLAVLMASALWFLAFLSPSSPQIPYGYDQGDLSES